LIEIAGFFQNRDLVLKRVCRIKGNSDIGQELEIRGFLIQARLFFLRFGNFGHLPIPEACEDRLSELEIGFGLNGI